MKKAIVKALDQTISDMTKMIHKASTSNTHKALAVKDKQTLEEMRAYWLTQAQDDGCECDPSSAFHSEGCEFYTSPEDHHQAQEALNV